MPAWLLTAYHAVSAGVNCIVEHSAQIGNTAVSIQHTAIDFVQCFVGKFFIS